MRRFVFSFGIGILVACGGSSSQPPPASPTASVSTSGMLLGKAFNPIDVMFAQDTSSGKVVTGVVITDYAGVCSDAKSNSIMANSNILSFNFTGSAALSPGTLSMATSMDPSVEVSFEQYDSMCNSPSGESTSAATFTLTRADANGLVGSFDLNFGTDHVTGTFSAPVCNGIPPGGLTKCK